MKWLVVGSLAVLMLVSGAGCAGPYGYYSPYPYQHYGPHFYPYRHYFYPYRHFGHYGR